MYIRAGMMIREQVTGLAHDKAIQITADYIGIREADYRENARAWHEFCPWTVVLAQRRRKTVGMSIVLPLKPEAYEEVYAGRLQSSRVRVEDLCVPSRHLLIEACAEHPATLRDTQINPTRSLLMCLALQLSALMRYQPGTTAGKYRWLSFAGTPTSQTRLLNTGFRPTGTCMFHNNLELFERVIDLDTGEGIAFIEAHVLSIGGQGCPPAPPLD